MSPTALLTLGPLGQHCCCVMALLCEFGDRTEVAMAAPSDRPGHSRGKANTFEARHKRPHVVWFHLYKKSRTGKSIDRKQAGGGQGLGRGKANGDGASFCG